MHQPETDNGGVPEAAIEHGDSERGTENGTVHALRSACKSAAIAAQAPADVDVAADLVATTDGGATWTALTTVGNAGWVPAGRWGTLSNLAQQDLAVGQTVRFGVRMGRVSGGADLSDSRCNLRVALPSRNGASSPF